MEKDNYKVVSRNKKALHEYEILDTLEVGIELMGSEIKSIRFGRSNLKDSYVRIIKGEMFLLGSHVSYLNTSNPHFKPEEKRARKLLAHKKEINNLFQKVAKEGLTIVALKMYFNHKNRLKLTIALARGKQLHDKRETLKRREADKEAKVAMKNFAKNL